MQRYSETEKSAALRPGLVRYGTGVGAGCDVEHPSADAVAQIEHGHQLSLSGQLTEAEACFRSTIKAEPDWPMPHNNLGWVLQAQGRNEEALVSYNKALQLAPALELAQTNLAYLLANLYFFIGKYAEAKSMWLFLADLYPQDQHVLDNLISTALRLHDLSDAGYWAARHAAASLPTPKVTMGKLRHDHDQYRYLRDRGLLDHTFEPVIDAYLAAIKRVEEGVTPESLREVPEISGTYGRMVRHYPASEIAGSAISRSASVQAAESAYIDSKLGVVVIDDFLSPEALSALQRFCLESTIWHRNSYSHDRLGAFFRDGFNCPLLLQIAGELQDLFPNIIGKTHPLLQMWGYKYRHDQPATHPHADFAAVNVNFWITPDEANLDKESGGLVIYDVEAPADWEFDAYNRQGNKISAFLKSADAGSMVIPYRCNRAVIFNSDLFHATAPLSFRPGYADKRVNITMLHGEREAEKKA